MNRIPGEYDATSCLERLGAQGECVIVGRGAGYVLLEANTLRVRLVAPLEDRIKAGAKRSDISRKQAERWVETTDAERARFVRDHYHRDSTEPARYDLLLNSSRFSLPECTDLIVEALHRMQTHLPEGQLLAQASAAVNQ